MGEWISVKDRLPENNTEVLVCGIDDAPDSNYHTMFIAKYIRKNTVECTNFDEEVYDYDEKTDNYYVEEGWFESIKNWDEYSSVYCGDYNITHWMPLPEPPKDD